MISVWASSPRGRQAKRVGPLRGFADCSRTLGWPVCSPAANSVWSVPFAGTRSQALSTILEGMNGADRVIRYMIGRHNRGTCLERGIAFPVQTTMASPAADPEFGLRHHLSAAQMTMVAVGGSIGTGLLLGTAAAIKLAGPAVSLPFVLAAFICCTAALALGEPAGSPPA